MPGLTLKNEGRDLNNILTLSTIYASDVQFVGKRAVTLSQIHQARFEIPLTFIIPNIIFHEFLAQNGLPAKIHKLLNSPNDDQDTYSDIYAGIKTLFEYAKIPEDFKEELMDAYETLSADTKMDVHSLISEGEPIANLVISPSYNLPFENITSGVLLNIHGFDNFLNGIKTCWLSLYSPEHLKYRKEKEIADFTAGIIVQKFIEADSTADILTKTTGIYTLSVDAYLGLPDIIGTAGKDRHIINKETFALESQEINPQQHILLKNGKSGTLLKRNLGKKGTTQKVFDKTVFEEARLSERISLRLSRHLRLLIQNQADNKLIFFAEELSERNLETDKEERTHYLASSKASSVSTESIEPKSEETLLDIINAPIQEEPSEPAPSDMTETKTPEKTQSDAFAWESPISSNSNPEVTDAQKSQAFSSLETQTTSEDTKAPKAFTFEENIDDFIMPDQNAGTSPSAIISEPKKELPSPEIINTVSQDNSAKDNSSNTPNNNNILKTDSSMLGPDNEFFSSIILDLEPGIDQEIIKRYQQKFNEVPHDLNSAMQKLEDCGELPEKEQIFKLKKMKEMLETGETINLDTFLDVTEKLRRAL